MAKGVCMVRQAPQLATNGFIIGLLFYVSDGILHIRSEWRILTPENLIS